MTGFDRWVARHRMLCRIIAAAFWFTIQITFLILDIPAWLATFFVVVALFITLAVIDNAPAASVKNETMHFMHHCDPYPYLNAIHDLLKYKHSKVMELCLILDYCSCLNNIGRYQDAWNRLSGYNIDKNAANPPGLKAHYYLILSESCTYLGMYEQADIWFQKAISIYNDMKEDKMKKMITSSVKHAHAEMALRHGNLDEAMAVLSSVDNGELTAQVFSQYILARVLIQKGDLAQARNALSFVIQNGNKLNIVRLANELLLTL